MKQLIYTRVFIFYSYGLYLCQSTGNGLYLLIYIAAQLIEWFPMDKNPNRAASKLI